MAINWGTPDTSAQPTGNTGDINWNLDQSQAALSHSQNTLNRINQQTQQTKQASDYANSPVGIAQETAKGTVGTLADTGIKFLRSAIQAPGDIINSLRGKSVDSTAIPGFSGTPQQTFQGEFQDKTAPAVMSGQQTPLGATARTVGGVVGGAADVLGAKGLGAPLKTAVDTVAEKTPGIVSKVTSPLTEYLAQRADTKALNSSVDAVYNSPTGKKFTQASGQVLTGKRELTPSSVFKEQGLTPDQQTVNLGTRLKDLGLGKDPVKNVDILSNDFTKTETKIDEAFKNGGVEYLADKQGLVNKIDETVKNAPEEFRIGDAATKTKQVADFAKRLVAKMPDSNQVSRTTRAEFDAQAKKQFPTAFKDGQVDTKTPAGSAIKAIRDSWNKHIYDTAPNGSELQNLIGREADLYRAAQVSLEKAKAGQGQNAIQQWIKENPAKAKVLGYGAAAFGGGEIYSLTH